MHCFSVNNKHGQTSNVIWLSRTWLLIFQLKVANKKLLFTKPASTWIEISCYKDIIFSRLQNFVPHTRLLHRENIFCWCFKNHKKLVFDTSTWYFLNYLQSTKVGTRKSMGIIWTLDAIYLFIHLSMRLFIYLYFCVKERKA